MQTPSISESLYSYNTLDVIEGYGAMINDKVRNRFYENILKDIVKDKSILEVGFGTGVLSFLALKYGAKKIISYEEIDYIYEIGKKIIEKSSFAEKIDLYNEKYIGQESDHSFLIHEVLGENIWSEFLYDIIKDYPKMIYPGIYGVDITCTKVDQDSLSLLAPYDASKINTIISNINSLLDCSPHESKFVFSPGVKFPSCAAKATQEIFDKIIKDSIHHNVKYEGVKINFSKLFTKENLSGYTLDVNNKTIEVFSPEQQKQVSYSIFPTFIKVIILNSEQDNFYMINESYRISHEENHLYLTEDYPGNHWDGLGLQKKNKIIRVPKGKTLAYIQNIRTGKVTYLYE